MIRKAIILSAGQGSRLLPLTADRPKCLIEVGGITIIDHQLDALARCGIEQVTVIGGYHFDFLETYLSNRKSGPAISVRFNPFWSLASSIGSVWVARDLLGAPFLLLNGDTVFDNTLLGDCLADFQPGLNLVVESVTEAEDDDMRVVVDGGRVASVGKAISTVEAKHRSLGIIGSPDGDGGSYQAALEEIVRRDNGALHFHHKIIDLLAQRETVNAITVGPAHWQEIDRPEDIKRWAFNHPQGKR